MIKGTNDTKYAYVNGIIRAREARLLTRSHFDRLISSELSSFTTILSDSPYTGYDDVTQGFILEQEKVNIFLKKYCQHSDIINFIDWPQQIHNIKVKIKQGSEDLLYKGTGREIEKWPEIEEEIEKYAMHKDPFILSTNFDKILCTYLYLAAKTMPFFKSYFELFFDLENIRSFFRARQFENTRDIFNQVFIDKGSLNRSVFMESITAGYDMLGRSFFNTPYARIFEKGIVYIEQKGSLLRLEKMCEEMRLGFLLMARRMTFGVEPLFAYYQFKSEEITKLRQVYLGKLNEVPIDDLKESIPDVW
jgi:V/A-type H+-transporting ATPase subunit C